MDDKHGSAIGQSLEKRTLGGIFWVFGGKIFSQTLALGRAFILGRLLSPHDFGLMGLGDLSIMFLSVFTYTGFGEALVQRPQLSPRIINTAWWVVLGRSVFVALALLVAAPLVATLFHEPAATKILRAIALVQLLSSFTSVGVTLIYKDMKFREGFKFEARGQIIDFLVAVTAAIIWRNVWALVLGSLAGTLTRVITSYALYPFKPSLVFDFKAAKELLRFGKWMLFSAIMAFVLLKGTDFFSGLLFGTVSLGIYQMASRFALLPTTSFGEVLLAALFPTYTLIQDDPEKLKLAFLKVLQLATFIIFPLSAFMAVILGQVLPIFLGAKWAGVAPLVPGLAVGGAVHALLRTGSPLFMATGNPNYQFRMQMASAVGILSSIYPLTWLLGLKGLTWSYAVGLSCGLPFWWQFVRRQSQAVPRDLLVAFGPSLLASLLLAASIAGPMRIFHLQLQQWNSLAWLLPLIGAGMVLYLGAILMMGRLLPGYQPFQNIWRLIKQGRQ